MKQYYWNVTGSVYRQSNLTFPFCKRSFWSWRQSWGTKSLPTTSSWTMSFHCPLPLASHSSSPWLEWCRLVPEEAWPSPSLVWVIVILHPVLALSLSQELTATLFFPWQTDLSFMPSFGLEFITHMGVHVPDFVDAGLEMHTSAYHESSLNAKISMKRNQIRLSIPAPRSNTQLLTFRSVRIHRHWFCLDFDWFIYFFLTVWSLKHSNKLLSISSSQILIVPPLVEDRTDFSDCQLLFSGLNLCTIVRYSNASSLEEAPYYPLTGETK